MRHPSGFDLLTGDDFPKPLSTNVWSKIIMSFLGRLPDTGLQSLTFPRRELPGKLLAISAAVLLLPQSQFPYPSPEFKIGDFVACDWEDNLDLDGPKSGTDFGEILGMRWLPKREPGLEAKTWVYFVSWTGTTTSGVASCYPCYDGEPTRECDLRLVKQS